MKKPDERRKFFGPILIDIHEAAHAKSDGRQWSSLCGAESLAESLIDTQGLMAYDIPGSEPREEDGEVTCQDCVAVLRRAEPYMKRRR